MKKNLELNVECQARLLEFLLAKASGSRTTVKSYLHNRQVFVNGVPVTAFDHQLENGDTVTIDFGMQKPAFSNPLLKILYEDDYIVVVSKKEGLLSIATDKQRSRTAYNIVSDYLKRNDPDARVFIVHRLDRETSGVMVFAKSMNMQHALQYNWEQRVLERKYFAVVEGCMKKDEDTVETFLVETKALKVVATQRPEGRIARTAYKVLGRGPRYSLLELQLKTGRKNQIRAQMEYLGHPVAGDRKYGAATDPCGRVMLHAGSLTLLHPVTEIKMTFTSELPREFSSDL